MTEAQRKKQKFRKSSKWTNFRKYLKNKQKTDFITKKPLLKGAQCHHLDMSEKNYEVLDEEKFVMLNRNMHKIVHELFRYYPKDHSILDRLKEILDEMERYNCEN